MRAAVARLGGVNQAAAELGVAPTTVAAWVAPTRRAKPDDATLALLAERSGVSLVSLETYFQNLEAYRAHQFFRRRRPQ